MRLLCVVAALSAIALAADAQSGIRPRSSASDYPAQESAGVATIGAAVVPPEQVKGLFSTDLKNYVVVEVSVYPEAGKTVDLAREDFALRIGASQDVIRPANPRAVAGTIQKQKAPPPPRASDITVHPTATIGYESGPSYDPATGTTRHGGVYTGAGVGVGVGPQPQGPPPPGSTDRDRETMRQELEDHSLPSVKTDRTVAGYLFFPVPDSKSFKGGAYELNYYSPQGKVRLLFPPVDRKK